MYKGQAALLRAEVIKFCSVMQVEKQLLIILPLVLACLCNTLCGSWLGLSRMHELEMQSTGGAEDTQASGGLCGLCPQKKGITESQNYRMIWVGRNFKGHLVPSLLGRDTSPWIRLSPGKTTTSTVPTEKETSFVKGKHLILFLQLLHSPTLHESFCRHGLQLTPSPGWPNCDSSSSSSCHPFSSSWLWHIPFAACRTCCSN